MVVTVGQKKSCAKEFPDIAGSLQTAWQEMARRNADVLPPEAFAQMDANDDLSKSPVFAKVSRAGCEALILQMPEISLRKLAEEQERLNEQRRREEQRQ